MSVPRGTCIALVSGGLDSSLAVLILKGYGIRVVGLNIYTGFSDEERRIRLGIKDTRRLAIISSLGIELEIKDVFDDFSKLLVAPRHGYGKRANPCIDCKILMLREAKKFMEDMGADFIITGEVLGQRPMSQTFSAIKLIEREAGVDGLVVRPLSGKLLWETVPEREGIVKREWFLGIRGRGRKVQIELAKKFGLEYPQPAGGCCLTDPAFSRRFFDFLDWSEKVRGKKEVSWSDTELLFLGRHFRLSQRSRLVISRDEREAVLLERLGERGLILKSEGVIGLFEGDDNDMELASKVIARYAKKPVEPL